MLHEIENIFNNGTTIQVKIKIVMFKFREHKVGLILRLKDTKLAGPFLFVPKLQACEIINNR